MPSRPFTPRPYQTMIMKHILDVPRCAIWASMGTGKSSATLSAINDLTLVYGDPVLVLAPKRVALTTWPEEARKWDHLKHLQVAAAIGTEPERIRALGMNVQIHTCNYDNLPWLVEYWGARWPYKVVISDESTRLKSHRLQQGGVRTKALAKMAHTKTKRFIQLTGTPAPNGLQDLWGQAWFLDKGARLGLTHESFKNRWFQRSHTGYGIDPLPHAQAEIQDRLKDICLTIDAKDWFDLKDPIVSNVYVDLPTKARQHYDEMEKDMFTQIAEHEVEAFGAAARTLKCLQIASGAAYVGDSNDEWKVLHDAKLEALESIIEEAAGMPALVAYHFKSDMHRLLKGFPRGRVLDSDPQTIRDWNAGKIPVLFAHPQSAGHGLNLQEGGNILVYFSHWWDLETRMQILERIGPMRQMQAGLDRSVFVYNIIARDTVDELVIERTDEKQDVQQLLLDAMKRKKR